MEPISRKMSPTKFLIWLVRRYNPYICRAQWLRGALFARLPSISSCWQFAEIIVTGRIEFYRSLRWKSTGQWDGNNRSVVRGEIAIPSMDISRWTGIPPRTNGTRSLACGGRFRLPRISYVECFPADDLWCRPISRSRCLADDSIRRIVFGASMLMRSIRSTVLWSCWANTLWLLRAQIHHFGGLLWWTCRRRWRISAICPYLWLGGYVGCWWNQDDSWIVRDLLVCRWFAMHHEKIKYAWFTSNAKLKLVAS